MDFLPSALEEYVEQHTQPESDLLNSINRETHLHVLKPRMLSGHLQGRVLAMLSKMISPSRILEIGTYTGYSALCLAEGLQDNGKIYTLDKNNELEKRVRDYFKRSNYASQIVYLIGDANDVLPTLEQTWDMVFIDADKKNYLNYYRQVISNVKSGGVLIADNVLWSGKIADPTKQDEDTLALREFNRVVHEDPEVENVLFPVRDGLMIIRKT